MAREEERDPERREVAARARGEEEEEEGEEGLSDSDDEDQNEKTGSGEEEEKEAAAAERERSEDARLQSTGLLPAALPAAAARDRSGRRSPGPPPGPLPCLPRMPSPEEEDRERRRSRRRDLLLSQLCFLALVALLVWSLSNMQEHNGECSLPAPSGRCGSGNSGLPGLGTGRAGWAGRRRCRARGLPLPLGGARAEGGGLKARTAQGEVASMLWCLASPGNPYVCFLAWPFLQAGGTGGGGGDCYPKRVPQGQ